MARPLRSIQAFAIASASLSWAVRTKLDYGATYAAIESDLATGSTRLPNSRAAQAGAELTDVSLEFGGDGIQSAPGRIEKVFPPVTGELPLPPLPGRIPHTVLHCRARSVMPAYWTTIDWVHPCELKPILCVRDLNYTSDPSEP
jgi:hypothetical protein